MKISRLAVYVCLWAVLVSLQAAGQAIIDPVLQDSMASGPGPHQVIATFFEKDDVGSLSKLGVPYLPLTVLPMAGAVLSNEQIEELRSWESVRSLYLNAPLKYFNQESGKITGAHYVQTSLGLTGRDQTIVVLDSGIDATHPDLTLGPKVIQNVKIVGDLGLAGTTLVAEGIINTDNTSGHGTHVAGTVGGTGAASAGDERDPYYYRGVAPASNLVGLGAGEALFILHALIGFDYAIANRTRYSVDVITNSWGNSTSAFDPNNPISQASFEAYRSGIVVTFAAGNDGPSDNTMSTYAINPWVIGVAAGTKSKELADFSSRGEAGEKYEHPDITAPGVEITSTRAPETPVGALGPVIDPSHPSYYLYYHTISGTSMATPFIAGTVALLLEANPELSPDQIEEIITGTADPMSGRAMHEVGAGYVNVRRAVEQALTVNGNRTRFLAGDTRWSSKGEWVLVEESDGDLGYSGQWRTQSDPSASGGAYAIGSVVGKGKKPRAYLKAVFFGPTVRIEHPRGPSGGTAEVLIDGISRGRMSFYGETATWGHRSSYANLGNTHHVIEIRALDGETYVDAISVDGDLFPANVEFVEETQPFTGSLGPSVEGIPETRWIPVEIPGETIQLTAELSWSGGVDLDLYLLSPSGETVASSASLENPEAFSYWVTSPGTYMYQIVGYATVFAEYTLTSTQTKAIPTSAPSSTASTEIVVSGESTAPQGFILGQNFPNPFNPETRIPYELSEDAVVSLKLYSVLGDEVATVAEGFRGAGRYTVRFRGDHLASGVYFLRFIATSVSGKVYTEVRRLNLLR